MNTWIESISNGFTIAIIYGILLFIPCLAVTLLVKGKKFNIAKYALNILFFGYMCCVFALVFLPLPTSDTELNGYLIQVIPGYCLYDIVKAPSIGKIAQVLFNIVMTIPFGAYLKYYWKMNIKKVTILSLSLTLFIEIAQLTGLFFLYSGSYRFCDIDDIICNTLGGVIGAGITARCTFLPDLDKFDNTFLHLMHKEKSVAS